MSLAIFEFLGTTEMLVILLVALIIFGPRKLPELGRSLGRSIGEFKRASEDFKRTWEREVEMDKLERELRIEEEVSKSSVMLPDGPALDVLDTPTPNASASDDAGRAIEGQTIARATSGPARTSDPTTPDAQTDSRKQDWL